MAILDQALPTKYDGQPTVYLLDWADREGKTDEIAKYGVRVVVDDEARCTVWQICPIEDFARAAAIFIRPRRDAAEQARRAAEIKEQADREMAPTVAKISEIMSNATPEKKAELQKILRGED